MRVVFWGTRGSVPAPLNSADIKRKLVAALVRAKGRSLDTPERAEAFVEGELEFLEPSSSVLLLTLDGRPAGLELPASVELEVVDTEPGVRGDTVSNVTKPAKLETGAIVQVPLFVNQGDRIKVDTRERRYISRA